jgi:hypothetical protein
MKHRVREAGISQDAVAGAASKVAAGRPALSLQNEAAK